MLNTVLEPLSITVPCSPLNVITDLQCSATCVSEQYTDTGEHDQAQEALTVRV
jgi:hypothetical protein